VEFGVERGQLVNPRFMAVENEQSHVASPDSLPRESLGKELQYLNRPD
jgi:hypothetical protein